MKPCLELDHLPEDRSLVAKPTSYVDTQTYDDDPGTDQDAVWTEVERSRNVQYEDGPELNDSPYHGAQRTGGVPGYDGFSGSFEYNLRKGTDTVYDFLKSARDNRTPILLRFMKDEMTVDGATGFEVPVLLGRWSETRDGGNDVAPTIPFQFVDCYDENGARIEKTDVTIDLS